MATSAYRTPLLWLAAVRAVIGLAAIPLAPALYREHFLVLVLMRPTKEVLLAGGFLAARDKVHLLQIVAAAVPLAIAGVWHAYALGRMHHAEIRSGKLPWLANRILRPEKVKRLQKILRRRGVNLIFLGRLAAFPSTLLGLAAGASRMPAKRFLPVDAVGGLVSVATVVGVGFALGGAPKGKTVVTIGGVATLLAFSILLGWYLRREPPAKQGRTRRSSRSSRSGTRRGRRTSPRRARAAAGR